MAKKITATTNTGIDRTIDEAHFAVQKVTAIGEKTYGIFLNPTGSNQYIPEADLDGITVGNLQIRMKEGTPSDEDNFVPGHGEYQSVDSICDLIAKANATYDDPSVAADQSVTQLLLMFHPGISAGDISGRKLAMSGVQSRFNKAVRLAWEGNG